MNEQYFKQETAIVASFVDSLVEHSTTDGVFDSASSNDFIQNTLNQHTSVKIPHKLQAVLDELPDTEHSKIAKAILDSTTIYHKQHGRTAPADIMEQAIHSAYTLSLDARKALHLDNADSNHHANLGLQPANAVVSILSTVGCAVPFAHYLPADIRSNEARLAIMTHHAGSKNGSYAVNASLDGASGGKTYLNSSRINTTKIGGDGKTKGKITAIQLNSEQCKQDAPELKILSGRTIVYVDGRISAYEVNSTKTGNSAISGKINIDNTDYVISGQINVDTGTYELASAPKLPNNIDVTVEAFIDFERAPELTPSIISAVNVYSLFANPWRVTTHQTIDTSTQMEAELGLDPQSEAVLAISAQFALERHYDALHKGMRLARFNNTTFDYAKAATNNYNGRASVWQDLAYPLAMLSQQMAIDTMDHGITHLYVGKNVAAQLLAMPGFEPSGIAPTPSIFRLGRLFGQYEVYFTPCVVKEEGAGAQILAVGRASDVARNPIVMGDAVPPTLMPLAFNSDMRRGMGFYARNFTAVNPHDAFSRGFGLINVINM